MAAAQTDGATGGSSLHLSHTISWKDLIDHVTVYKDEGIKLPAGGCGRIHVIDKETEIKVHNRPYLHGEICTDPECKPNGEKAFRKSQKKVPVILSECELLPWQYTKYPSLSRFIDSFSRAIDDFTLTERKKVGDRNSLPPLDPKEVKKRLKEEGHWPLEQFSDWYGCNCTVFTMLMELGDTKTLLSFSNEQIREVLFCQHGGQAVGNNIRFLTYYVLRAYLYTNLITLLDLQDKPDEWGPMKPGAYFRRELGCDCDGQTFLFGSRKYLTEEKYMKDWEGMRELVKNCFKFLYILNLVRKEVVDGEEAEDTRKYFFD